MHAEQADDRGVLVLAFPSRRQRSELAVNARAVEVVLADAVDPPVHVAPDEVYLEREVQKKISCNCCGESRVLWEGILSCDKVVD